MHSERGCWVESLGPWLSRTFTIFKSLGDVESALQHAAASARAILVGLHYNIHVNPLMEFTLFFRCLMEHFT